MGFFLFLCCYFLLIYTFKYGILMLNFTTIGWTGEQLIATLLASIEWKVWIYTSTFLILLFFYLTPWPLPYRKVFERQ